MALQPSSFLEVQSDQLHPWDEMCFTGMPGGPDPCYFMVSVRVSEGDGGTGSHRAWGLSEACVQDTRHPAPGQVHTSGLSPADIQSLRVRLKA